MNKKDAKLKIKSRYNVIFDFLYNHAITLLIIILILVVLVSKNQLVGIGTVILIGYLVYLVAKTIYNAKKYKNSYYEFYSDKLIYNNKIKEDNKKEIKYTEMTQIKYSQTFLQTMFKLGTIIIYTNKEKILDKIIFINYVKDVKIVYEKILKVIGEKQKDNNYEILNWTT